MVAPLAHTPLPTRRRKPSRRVARCIAWLVGVVALLVLVRSVVFVAVEYAAFDTPPPGMLRPDTLGAPSQAEVLDSDGRRLHATWVPVDDPAAPALLVFHGDGEDLSRWAAVQARLHAAGVASYVFDYSGYGASEGRPTLVRLRQDALQAWARFVALTPQAAGRFALGFSMGTAVLVDAMPLLAPAPKGVVLGAGFASAREMAVLTGLIPHWAAWLLPDLWNSERDIARVAQPLLIVHSRADEDVPAADALRLCHAARAPRRLVMLDGLSHEAPLEPAQSAPFWDAVLGWVKAEEPAPAQAGGCEG